LAVSRDPRNTRALKLKQSGEALGWGFPVEGFAWTAVELSGDGSEA
jgi:hypothetical protein